VSDRLFSLLIFLHIGLPLALLGAMWVHVQRLADPATHPPRALGWSTATALVALCLAWPVASGAPADLQRAPHTLALDWFYLGVHVVADATTPRTLWVAAGGLTLLLLALPWLSRRARAPRPQPAFVDLANCNGCGRCFADCPYAAVTLRARTDERRAPRQAVVAPDRCAGCGICAGACPSSTPFRSAGELETGIDMPQAPIAALRVRLESAVQRITHAGEPGIPRIVIFGCPPEDGGADLARFVDGSTAAVALLCAGQLPPSFVEYALRTGADGIVVTGCREGDCGFRHGNRWTDARFAGARDPRLRVAVPGNRVRVTWVGRQGEAALAAALASLRADLARAAPARSPIRPKRLEKLDESRSRR
jgi:coenzyme F420-reducing hydrogenase delta subunit/ferredoxin